MKQTEPGHERQGNDNILLKYLKNHLHILVFYYIPASIYLLQVNNKNTRTRCEVCSKLTITTPERRHLRHYFHFPYAPPYRHSSSPPLSHTIVNILTHLLLALNK